MMETLIAIFFVVSPFVFSFMMSIIITRYSHKWFDKEKVRGELSEFLSDIE